MIILNITNNELFVLDPNGIVSEHKVFDNANVTSAVLLAYIKSGKFFSNVKYMSNDMRVSAQQTGIWTNGEDCMVEQNHNPLI